MTDPMTGPLSTDCPARKMARDFIAKFKQDDGVMRSLHKRNVALSEIVRKPKPSVPWIPPAIGRWGSHFLRQNFSECAIGDAVPVASDHPEGVEVLLIYIHPPGDYDSPEKRRFQKVCFEMMWCGIRNTKFFWERVE